MGLTKHTFDLITKHCDMNGTMLELGDQIIYFGNSYGEYSTPYFKKFYPKLQHTAIDIKPEKHAIEKDLREPLDMGTFDSITNAGTTEHVESVKGFYNAFKHIHESCNVGGVMVHENPKTENWAGHGEHYMTQGFYIDLAKAMDYEILSIGEHPAMGNTTDGWNVYCVLRKKQERNFVTFKEFKTYDFRKS
jgi:hypothetical protein